MFVKPMTLVPFVRLYIVLGTDAYTSSTRVMSLIGVLIYKVYAFPYGSL